MRNNIGVALVGCGGIALANHVPGVALCPGAQIVALCDADEEALDRASQRTGITTCVTRYTDALELPSVDAVIIATPNVFHAPIAHAAIAAGKHVLCEKPLAMTHAEALGMAHAADAAGVRHMTAFTYRFVPAMRYMQHLIQSGAVGQPYHFRVARLQDWGRRALGWRQVQALAGSGELGDMLSHRIDYGHLLIGPIRRLVAQTRRYLDDREGQPSNLEDWVAILAEFDGHVTEVLESSKIASGRSHGGRSQDYCEVNGSEGSLVYHLARPHELQIGRLGGNGLETVAVPEEFLVWPGSPRDPHAGDPLATFRYDQDAEFVQAIREQRPCRPSFHDGARAQAVIDAALLSAQERRWVDVPDSTTIAAL